MLRSLAQNASRAARVQQTRAFSSRVLVLADHDNKNLGVSTYNVVTAASKLGGEVSVLVSGNDCKGVADEAAKIQGVSEVLCVQKDSLANHIAENVSAMVQSLQGSSPFTHIVGGTSATAKAVMPRLSAALDVAQISDVIEVKDANTFVRPIYAGNAIATVEATDDIKLLTVRPTSFDAAAKDGSASVSEPSLDWTDGTTTWTKDALSASDRPQLGSANVVISGGRGMGNGENFAMLETLADKLGGAVGASRAAVDAGYAPNDMQVGQTGKVVAPDLYMAFGISGAIQHLSGMKDSKTIVCVNKDPEAAIFQVSDYGVVNDLFKVVPELNEKL